jgi:hypothetical protein
MSTWISMHVSIFRSIARGSLLLTLAFVAPYAHAADIQMLPPSAQGSTPGAVIPCTALSPGNPSLPGWDGTNPINCITGVYSDPSGNVTAKGTATVAGLANLNGGIAISGPNGNVWISGASWSTGTATYGPGMNIDNTVFLSTAGLNINNQAILSAYGLVLNGTPDSIAPNNRAHFCLNGTCIKNAVGAQGESATLSAIANVGNNWHDDNQYETQAVHDLCVFTAVQHTGLDSNCNISGSPGGVWTLSAQSGIAGSGQGGQTNCAVQCYDWR